MFRYTTDAFPSTVPFRCNAKHIQISKSLENITKLHSSEERLTFGPRITDKQALNHFPADSSKQLS